MNPNLIRFYLCIEVVKINIFFKKTKKSKFGPGLVYEKLNYMRSLTIFLSFYLFLSDFSYESCYCVPVIVIQLCIYLKCEFKLFSTINYDTELANILLMASAAFPCESILVLELSLNWLNVLGLWVIC